MVSATVSASSPSAPPDNSMNLSFVNFPLGTSMRNWAHRSLISVSAIVDFFFKIALGEKIPSWYKRVENCFWLNVKPGAPPIWPRLRRPRSWPQPSGRPLPFCRRRGPSSSSEIATWPSGCSACSTSVWTPSEMRNAAVGDQRFLQFGKQFSILVLEAHSFDGSLGTSSAISSITLW